MITTDLLCYKEVFMECSATLLPLSKDIETKTVLRKALQANKALAELKGTARTIPNQSILINALALQEAKDSSEIENIATTHDELYRSMVSSSNISQAAKEVKRYREALYRGLELVNEHHLLLTRHIVEIQGRDRLKFRVNHFS